MRLRHILTRPGNVAFGHPVGRGALGSSLYRTCFGKRFPSIRHTRPAHRRRPCQMVMRSYEPVACRTEVLDTGSF